MMTSEQIEGIKKKLTALPPSADAPINSKELCWLLAALEEAEQEVKEWQDEAKQWRDDFVEKNNELGEAQQTIALKQSSIDILVGQVTDETALHAKTAAKLITAEQTIARQREALQIAMSQNQSPEVYQKVKKLVGEGAKESRTYIEPDEDAVTTEEEAFFVNEDVKEP